MELFSKIFNLDIATSFLYHLVISQEVKNQLGVLDK